MDVLKYMAFLHSLSASTTPGGRVWIPCSKPDHSDSSTRSSHIRGQGFPLLGPWTDDYNSRAFWPSSLISGRASAGQGTAEATRGESQMVLGPLCPIPNPEPLVPPTLSNNCLHLFCELTYCILILLELVGVPVTWIFFFIKVLIKTMAELGDQLCF